MATAALEPTAPIDTLWCLHLTNRRKFNSQRTYLLRVKLLTQPNPLDLHLKIGEKILATSMRMATARRETSVTLPMELLLLLLPVVEPPCPWKTKLMLNILTTRTTWTVTCSTSTKAA